MDEHAEATDGMPWQVKAAFLFGAPTVFAAYLIYTVVGGIVPAMVSQQTTMTGIVNALSAIMNEHSAAKQQNEQILRVLRASCVNQAVSNVDRARCLE